MLGVLLAVVVWAPAAWLANSVAQVTQGQLLLTEPRGTLWTGSARLILAGGFGSRDAAALPGRIEWALRPVWLGLGASVRATCCTTSPLELRATARGLGGVLTFSDGNSHWPASLLAGLGTPWNTLQPEGSLRLQTDRLSVKWFEGRVRVGGRARLDALEVSSRLSTLRPMGSYRITIEGGSTSTLQLETLEGALQLSGTGRWVGSRLHFGGEATAAPEREAALSNLLNIIGRRNGARSIITVG